MVIFVGVSWYVWVNSVCVCMYIGVIVKMCYVVCGALFARAGRRDVVVDVDDVEVDVGVDVEVVVDDFFYGVCDVGGDDVEGVGVEVGVEVAGFERGAAASRAVGR